MKINKKLELTVVYSFNINVPGNDTTKRYVADTSVLAAASQAEAYVSSTYKKVVKHASVEPLKKIKSGNFGKGIYITEPYPPSYL